MPSYTFVSTANAFALRGARIRFIDIRADTLNLDETQLERVISEAPPGALKAIVPVHYAGIGCAMTEIMELAAKYRLRVIEDAAQGVNATFAGEYLGGIGDLGAYSFHETKNFISGEGGALLINDPELIERAEIIREKGTDRSKFFRGEIDKYSWVDLGSSYLPSELVAAFLFAQLEAAAAITQARLKIFNFYAAALQPLAERGYISLPTVPANCTHNAHMFYILVNTGPAARDQLLAYLKGQNIHAVFHYVPLHLSPMGGICGAQAGGYHPGDLPRTESLSSRLLRLPCYFELTQFEQERVVTAIENFFQRP